MTEAAIAALELGLVNDLRQIAGIAGKIDSFCADREISPEIAYAVNLALEELLSNTIEHGYPDDEPHRIEIILRQEGESLVVIIVDDGEPFDPTRAGAAGSDTGANLEDGHDGGLGLLLVNHMMDQVEHQRRADCNVVTLTKSITKAVASSAG